VAQSDGYILLTQQSSTAIDRPNTLFQMNPFHISLPIRTPAGLIEAASAGEVRRVRQELDRGADANMVVNSKTALIEAVRIGSVNIVRLLLDQGTSVNIETGYETALMAAARIGSVDIMRLLLDRGADVNTVANNTTALIVAVCRWDGVPDIERLLLDGGANVNMVVNNQTALIAAAQGRGVDTVRLLLDRDADVNISAKNTTALLTAVCRWDGGDIVRLLLDRGANVNLGRAKSSETTLIVAARMRDVSIVRLLLDRAAKVNMVANNETALIVAARGGRVEIVQLLLSRAADVNIVANNETALIVAARGGHVEIVQLLLDRAADVNLRGSKSSETALIAAASRGSVDIVRLLLGNGADVNIVANNTTALITAMCACQSHPLGDIRKLELLSILLDHKADVSIVAGVHGTALLAAISKLEFDVGPLGGRVGWQWRFLQSLLLSVDRVEDNINVGAGDHGTALTTAISNKKVQLVELLVGHGADVNRLGGSYGTPLGAALATALEPKERDRVIKFLLDKGADINAVSCLQFGSELGKATYMGDKELVSFLLKHGADPFHVGGTYDRTALTGRYPNALDAAQSSGSKAGPALIAVLMYAMKCKTIDTDIGESRSLASIPPVPPFPVPYPATYTTTLDAGSPTGCALSTGPNIDHESICNLPTHGILTTQQADLLCTAANEELIAQALVKLVVGIPTNTPEFEHFVHQYQYWIRNDVRYFVTQGYDFGQAYAAARVGWKHFNEPGFMHMAAYHRGQWLRTAKTIGEARVNSIYRDPGNTEQEMIKLPYKVMPRRLWDLKSNRVVEFRSLHSEILAYNYTEMRFGKISTRTVDGSSLWPSASYSQLPAYWAISHSWESSMNPVGTPINQYQWKVPLPHGLDLDHDLRQELLNYGIAYVWLDVMCLRQHNSIAKNQDTPQLQLQVPATDLNEIREEEWKIDVPTIGNIYRAAQGIVRYFNGLGRSFSTEGWDNSRHWLQRAWTLQEIKTENSTINGGVRVHATGCTPNIMKLYGKVEGKAITLRHAIRPLLKLAAEVDYGGCSLYGLAREMSRRDATQATDKVAGLLYLLRPTQLPTYDAKVTDEDAWKRCFHVLPLARKMEILFDFPYRGNSNQWFPTWRQLLRWPELDHDYDHSPVVRVKDRKDEKRDLAYLEEVANKFEASLFLSGVWAISSTRVTLMKSG